MLALAMDCVVQLNEKIARDRATLACEAVVTASLDS